MPSLLDPRSPELAARWVEARKALDAIGPATTGNVINSLWRAPRRLFIS
jgi:hypothetical protein